VRAADDPCVSSALRRSLAVAAAAAVAASVSAPDAVAKPRPKHTRAAKVCAVKSGSLRPSPVRACRKASKAPRVLPR
jgi:hypothetical protein